MTRSSCATPDELRRLLDGSLSEQEGTELQLHLEGCTACQQQLEQLVADGSFWQTVAQELAREPADAPELQQVVEKLQVTPPPLEEAGPDPLEMPLPFIGPPEEPGTIGRLKHYDILRVAGRGGMGVVVKAFDRALRRVVAIKLLAPHLAGNALARQRFVREGRASAAICHEHVVTIHAVEENPPFLVMQYVQGETLQARIDRTGIIDIRETLRIGKQIAEGLAAAHEQGVVHRDIKPANILLENGVARVRITDFGLARAVDDASLTQSGVVAGTPQYMAPEQASGDAVDERADLFSLGSVLYTMLAGHAPFRASTAMGVLKRLCDDMPRPLREINPDVPDWLVVLINRLHAKRPADRFQSAQEVAELLGRGLASLQNSTAGPVLIAPVATPTATSATPATMETAWRAGHDESLSARSAAPESKTWTQRLSLPLFAFGLPLMFVLGLALHLSPLESALVSLLMTIWLQVMGWMLSSRADRPGAWQRFANTLPDSIAARIRWLLVMMFVVISTLFSLFFLERQAIHFGMPHAMERMCMVLGSSVMVTGLLAVRWFRRKRPETGFVFAPRTRWLGPLLTTVTAAMLAFGFLVAAEMNLIVASRVRDQQQRALLQVANARLELQRRNCDLRFEFEDPAQGIDVVMTQAGTPVTTYRRGPDAGRAEMTPTLPEGTYEWSAMRGSRWIASGQVTLSPDRETVVRIPKENFSARLRGRWRSVAQESLPGMGSPLEIELEFFPDRVEFSLLPEPGKGLETGSFRMELNEKTEPFSIDFFDRDSGRRVLSGILRIDGLPNSIGMDPSGPAMGTASGSMMSGMSGMSSYGAGGSMPSGGERLLICHVEGEQLRPWDFRPGANGSVLWTFERADERISLRQDVPPGPLAAGASAVEIRQRQKRWAEFLKVEPQGRNSLGQELVLVPPAAVAWSQGFKPDHIRTQTWIPEMTVLDTPAAPAEVAGNPGYQAALNDRPGAKSPFVISRDEVSVVLFRQFVAETDYRTDAEKGDEPAGGWIRQDGKFVLQPGQSWQSRRSGETVSQPEDSLPVTMVSWNDATAFCEWLSRKEGRQYRLPTELEWTCAAQLGTTACGPAGMNSSAEMKPASDASGLNGHPLGVLWLYGNAAEWNQTSIGDDSLRFHILSGRAVQDPDSACGLLQQRAALPEFRADLTGFRVVAEVRVLPAVSLPDSSSTPASSGSFGSESEGAFGSGSTR